jgi:hypothetical protein
MNGSLFGEVAAALDRQHVGYALIGAGALAVHGVARSTFDLDILTTDPRVLDLATWAELTAGGRASVTVRRGDVDDPLAGVVRVDAPGERPIDTIVGRFAWQSEIVERAESVTIQGTRVRVAGAGDLILLKLYAGGVQDAWDIQQLLAVDDRDRLVAEVESRLALLPSDARSRWTAIVPRG